MSPDAAVNESDELFVVHMWSDEFQCITASWLTLDQFHDLMRPIDAAARKRFGQCPRCSVCAAPMTCDQADHHRTCAVKQSQQATGAPNEPATPTR